MPTKKELRAEKARLIKLYTEAIESVASNNDNKSKSKTNKNNTNSKAIAKNQSLLESTTQPIKLGGSDLIDGSRKSRDIEPKHL